MNGRRKLAFGAGAVGLAGLVVGLGAAGAIAASRMLSPNDESKAVIDDAAAQLGVQPQALSDALKQALKNRIDEAVDAGRLTEEHAKALKERIDSGDYPLLFGRGLGGPPRGMGLGLGRPFGGDLLETAAGYLGMSEADLREALRDQTLAEIAKDKGKSASGLVTALVAAQQAKIDEAVADGRITKAQATELKANLADRMQALVNGSLSGLGGGFGHRFWPGWGVPRAPPAHGGPSA